MGGSGYTGYASNSPHCELGKRSPFPLKPSQVPRHLCSSLQDHRVFWGTQIGLGYSDQNILECWKQTGNTFSCFCVNSSNYTKVRELWIWTLEVPSLKCFYFSTLELVVVGGGPLRTCFLISLQKDTDATPQEYWADVFMHTCIQLSTFSINVKHSIEFPLWHRGLRT